MPKANKKAHSKAGSRASVATPCTKCPLRPMEAFRKFTEQELEFVKEFKSGELVLEPGHTIFSEGTNSPYLYTVLSGWAFKYKTLEDGRRQILNYALPGDLIGLQASIFDSISHSVEALTSVVLCVFPREKLWSLFENHPGLAFDVTWLGAREESILGEYLVTVGQRHASERIAFVLLHLFQRARQLGLARDSMISLPMTQAHLADTIGFSLVHTNKSLKHLRETGTFKWSGTTFELLDEEGLAGIVGHVAGMGGVRPFI